MKLLSALAIFSTLAWTCRVGNAGEITAVREANQLVFWEGNSEILRYQAEPGELPKPGIKAAFIRGGYIQSIHTPSGRLITDDFPNDHFHHHGVWSPWTKTEFEGRHPDFWNMGAETGKVEFVSLDQVWQKDGSAGFQAKHQFVDLTSKPAKVALLETWNITVSAEAGRYIIDYTSTQQCATGSPLKLPEYHYGGFGFRGHHDWIGPANCQFITSTGLTDRLKVDRSRAKWCWVGGKVDHQTCGVTILCHPANFRFPQPIRANPDQPFFCFAPQQLGEMEISPGQKYISRYRLIVADGTPDASQADQWWSNYGKN